MDGLTSSRNLRAVVFGLATMIALPAFGSHTGIDLNNVPKDAQVFGIKTDDTRATIRELSKQGYDVLGIDAEKGVVDVLVPNGVQAAGLEIMGFNIYDSKPINVTRAPDEEYTTYAEMAEQVQAIAAAYPNITKLEVIGQSVEGRDIYAMKITDNPEIRETDESTILFNSMHHAREIMTVEVAIDTIEYLAENYGSNADVTRWVDTVEIWVIPMVNPDGNNKVWTTYNMWRKNTRGGYGVDLNRNYPYNWNTCNGSSGSTWSDTYRGPEPASEPETQALMNFVAQTQPVFDISYHSYSELVLYPFGCGNERTPTREIVEGVGQELARLLPRDQGSGHYTPGTPWELLYNADGGDIDWMYGEYNVIPYVIELNSRSLGFQPDYRWRQPTVEKLRAGWGFLLDRMASSGIRGIVRDGAGRALNTAMVHATSMGEQLPPISWRVKADGTYHLVLNPGMYTLRFEADGQEITREVIVGDNLVVEDIEF